MSKLTKNAEILDTLKKMVLKEKEAAQSASGVPGQDTNYTRVSDETDHTNKNEVGPEKLNDKQKYEQKPSSDPSEPSKAKSAEELAAEKAAAEKAATEKAASEKAAASKSDATQAPASSSAPEAPISQKHHSTPAPATAVPEKTASVEELGKQVLDAVNKLAEQSASGVPGQDTHYTRVSDETDHTNKNEVGPEKLNDKQKYEQKPSTDKSEPSKAKSAEEEAAEKIASFEYGRTLAAEFLKEAFASEPEIYKQAGRRDFETLIAQAAQELEQPATEKKASAEEVAAQEKAAEEAGATAFAELYKRAQYEVQLEKAAAEKAEAEKKATELAAKLATAEAQAKEAAAKLAETTAALQKKAEDEKRAAEISAIVDMVSTNIFERLKNEAVRSR
jgi:hypothetical protein